jgi:hypothetical protein
LSFHDFFPDIYFSSRTRKKTSEMIKKIFFVCMRIFSVGWNKSLEEKFENDFRDVRLGEQGNE